MQTLNRSHCQRQAFTMLELSVAMVAAAFLLAGLASVMMIARQVAYTPTAASRRSKTADVVNEISDELRYATVITQQTAQALEFVVTDRNSDGTAEKIRYEWSGVAGDPLRKTINGATAVDVLTSVYAFGVTLQSKSKTTTFTTTVDSNEALLVASAAPNSLKDRDISATSYSAQTLDPNVLFSVPSNALSWNLTKIDFYGKQEGAQNGQTLQVQLRHTSDPLLTPTSSVAGQVSVPKTSLTTSDNWNTVTFASPVRNLVFNRQYVIVFTGSADKSARLRVTDSAPSAVYESEDGGASWQAMSSRGMFARLYGTYTTPGPSYNVVRNYISCVGLTLQSGDQAHSRVDSSVPLRNCPELLTNYWRTDFDRNPATTNGNGDSASDWAVTGGGTFDSTKLAGGVWTATGALETRPLSDFTTTTTVEVRCRNTSVGGNGTVVAIYADRQIGSYAPILVYLQKQSDGTQTLTLSGRTSDSVTRQLFSRSRLSSGFVRFRVTIVPQSDVVNLQINDEDQGTFTYPTYSPSATTDRYLTISSDTSSSEFDYVELRSGTN